LRRSLWPYFGKSACWP